MEELKKPILLCRSCRKVFIGRDFSLNGGCPGCNSKKVLVVFDANSLIEDSENSNAFQALVQISATNEQLEKVARLMGVEGGMSNVRVNSKQYDALEKWKSENGCYF